MYSTKNRKHGIPRVISTRTTTIEQQPMMENSEYRRIIEECTQIAVETNNWFPTPIANWIKYNATILGVSDVYLSYPILSAITYCAQHATVELEDGMHKEPVLLYGLVGGRSGTNKSAALKKITDMISNLENPRGMPHVFDTGTAEGLMKAMADNNGTIMASKDEFASFNDNFEKSSTSNMEKSRFLSLYSCAPWSRTTKCSGSLFMNDPRFNLIAFTQPYYMANFAQSSTNDGFFQRFFTSLPREKFVKRDEKRKMMMENEKYNEIDIENMFQRLYRDGQKKTIRYVYSLISFTF